ncbi:MAG TPA: SDR family oxidoreductase [Thermoanaerobaculia bacterium]|jgi:NAD(P)-dependent dehydrogenase (short-subunit alcohol dehydrogenase family)|nr:SDR family oxidoreductase [Thermoanaerobaculia bacterium]
MNSEFGGKVVVVTGASSGIGRATAEMFVERGARVAIFARSREKLNTIAGKQMLAVSGDAAREQDIEHLFTECESRFGSCEILINCAGMIDPERLVRTTTRRWDRMFAVNVRSMFLTCRRALPSMIERRSGAIVNLSSISGVLGPEKFPGYVSYCASKAAVIGFTEALAVEVKEQGIRVNCISPGSVDTPMWAEAGGGEPAEMSPQEVARIILFLASNDSRPIDGQNVHVYSS